MTFYYFKIPYVIYDNYRDSIIIIKDNWDDMFKYETNNHLKYVDLNGVIKDLGEVKIAQMDMQEEQRTANIPNVFETLSEGFFSLGQSDDYYARIAELGDAKREEILRALRDISFDLDLYSKVCNLDVTRISLLRGISSFSVKRQFNRIAHGKARLTNYNIEYAYPCPNNEVKLQFNVVPESCPPTNIHVIIGRNNVGKTFFIKNFIKAAYFPDEKDITGTLRSSNDFTNRLMNSQQQVFANILCVSFSPFDDYSDLRNKINISSVKDEMPFSFIGLNSNEKETLTDIFYTGINTCQKSNRKLKLLKEALNVLETDPIFVESKIRELLVIREDFRDGETEYKNKIENIFRKLSSGHQVIVLTLVQLIANITERSLVVLDEPENHLHPPLLAAFIRALSELLIDRNGVALIATHSPVVLQEVPKSCAWKINRYGKEVRVSRLEIESFGATIGALTREIFGLEVKNSGFHKMLIEEVKNNSNYEEIVAKFNNELGDEARVLLRTLLLLKNKNEKFE